ncbi:optineurin [Myripristis murdjan]|uniref:Optineurin n=1 Tax=Myripristis murdjan TaxID=586833 RepID=A0A667WXZ5_9TELE|nr:optineurin [Myripristis murdjan]
MLNGDVSRGAGQSGTLEETLQQMNILIQENRDLKEALRQTNLSMKERFEGLSAWREKQKKERDFLESRLEEARDRMETLSRHNQELSRRLEERGGPGPEGAQAASANQRAELEGLRAQLARLQAEKNDLVALNSELQLKASQGSSDDSFIEVIKVTDGQVDAVRGVCSGERGGGGGRLEVSMTASRLESEELTVSQLLQSLRNETQKAERLQAELQAAWARVTELESRSSTDTSTQTTDTQEDSGKEEKAESEVENLKAQMMTLFKELQQAQSKLDEAEGMKKNLQDRCREVEQDVATLRAQLHDRQAVQSENERLKVQLDSMQSQNQLEQRKAGEDRNNLAQLKDAYTKLFEDYNELKDDKKKREKELVDELQGRLDAAEQALATKQERIDAMKQEIYQKEKELETISVFQAQAEVYSSDFYAERAAREKIHEEKERLAAQLEFVKKQNTQLQEEMDSLGRKSLNEMQRRHVSRGSNPHGGAAAPTGRGGDSWQQQGNIPEHACPKCNEILPDLDSLQIHIMDCII